MMFIIKCLNRNVLLLKLVNNYSKNVRTITRNGFRLNSVKPVRMAYASYQNTSSGDQSPPLFLMHGLFGSKGNWNSLCKAMQAKFVPARKIIAVDARNHGESPHVDQHGTKELAVDIKHLMEVMNIKKACLMGHSMGGRAVMYFALKYPELVDKLIVVDISPVDVNDQGFSEIFDMFGLLQNVKFDSTKLLSEARKDADEQLAKSITDKSVRAFLLTNLVKKDGTYTWRINIPALIENYHRMTKLPNVDGLVYNGKTLFIKGELSDFIHRDDIHQIKKLFPNVTFVEIKDAGHWVHSEQPAIFLQHVIKFLNS